MPTPRELADLAGTAQRLGQQVLGSAARTGWQVFGQVTGQVSEQVTGRLIPQLVSAVTARDSTPPPDETRPAPEVREGLGDRMRRLLEDTGESGGSDRQRLFHHILDQLVPDEARVLDALSGQEVVPSVDVHESAADGSTGRVVVAHLSPLGRSGGLSLPQLAPTYVSHLLSLGLVEVGPADDDLTDEYERLAADTSVLRAVKRATNGSRPARIEKHTLRLSGLGLELWAASRP